MKLEEAIKTALVYEMKVRDVYQDAAMKASDPAGQRVFRLLAREEQYHINYLEDKLDEWQKSGAITATEVKSFLPGKKQIKKAVTKLDEKLAVKNSDQELQMLQRALEVERETATFYKKMVAELSDEGQKMFARFVEVEEGHEAIVQAEIDSVSGSGFWFDMPEFSLEV